MNKTYAKAIKSKSKNGLKNSPQLLITFFGEEIVIFIVKFFSL
jgi:hypothetical protein